MLIRKHRSGRRLLRFTPISCQTFVVQRLIAVQVTARADHAITAKGSLHSMRSSKSRSRNKSRNSRPTGGNIINRVFDSSGPDGKVRGTPQQVIEKYNQLHRDAQLAGDRVNAENFAQHAEHYTRMLAEAQREVDQRREEQEAQNRERQAERDRERQERLKAQEDSTSDDVSEVPATQDDDQMNAPQQQDSGLVETPEDKPKRPRKPRAPRKPKAESQAESATPDAAE